MKRTSFRTVSWNPVRPSVLSLAMGAREYESSSGCHAIVSAHPEEGLHISVSAPDRYPSWDELASARDKFGGPDRRMMMLFPPRSEYVNVHQTTLHLWEVSES